MGKNMSLRAKTKANLKPELKMKSAYENYLKSSIEHLQKSLPFRVIYVKYLEKNNI